MSTEKKKRPNGLLQSCDQCRKSKVRCDHQGPHCSRCVSRGLLCNYDAAPTTKRNHYTFSVDDPVDANSHSSTIAFMESQSPTSTQLPSLNRSRTSVPTFDQSSASSVRNSTGLESNATIGLFNIQGPSDVPTRYSAVFSENQRSFAPAIQALVNPTDDPQNSLPNEIVDITSESLKDLAIETLLHFPTFQTCEILLLSIDFIHDVWISPTMIRRCLEQLWEQYGKYLGSDRSRESAWAMAQDLHQNGKQKVAVVDSDLDWVNWFSGTALRWEMIGILFAWAGMAFKHKQEWDSVFKFPEQQKRNRRASADRMRVCSVDCLKFCSAKISDISVCLKKNSVKLQAMLFTDEDDQLQADFGTVRKFFIIAGLDRLPKVDKDTPLSQYRSCISASMYNLDKRDSLFHGHQPMLNKPYCHCPPPLDLSEDDLYNGPERLASAISRLSPGGWNTDGKIYTTTWLRADYFLSLIREDIALLALSFNRQFTVADVDKLVVRLKDTIESYPPQLRYQHKTQWAQETSSSTSAEDSYIVAHIRLEVLQCSFLLQRLKVSRGGNGQELFETAEEIMAVIISIWSNRDHIQNHCHRFDWIVFYAIPAAVILCVELLKVSAAASSTTQPSHSTINISRSKVLQSLVMFVAYLDWIRPTDNNAKLCWRFRDMLRRIIDTAFDPPRAPNTGLVQEQTPPTTGIEHLDQSVLMDAVDYGLPGMSPFSMFADDLDFLKLPVDWSQGSDWS